MAREPRVAATTLGSLSRDQLLGIGRISALETTDSEFSSLFKTNPGAALAAKGIVISDAQSAKLQSSIASMVAGRGALAAETEIEVSVKVKF
ncbi:MAG: hypothetical protein P4M09_15050 [Devosia sp.]|nr:hypothetical protein [Devosia sp.]